ncbi:hypothetical protein FRC17_004068 [Serendipita sp. 399]|nr:hypothetical protein FRC17_004068 [Serendipita sp. 399]
MGSSSSTASKAPPPPLPPLPEQLGAVGSLCFPYEVTLVLKEQVGWSGDSFSILDINKTPCFQIKGRAMSFSQKKVLHDMQGQAILNFRHEIALFEKKYCIYAGSDQTRKVATIKVQTFMGVSATIEFTNINGQSRCE